MMNNQSVTKAINAIIQVINSAPGLYQQTSYIYPQSYQNRRTDISKAEFDTWVNYADQILDISYNYVGYNIIFSTKITICQISNQLELPYFQRVESIKTELLNLIQSLSNY